MSGLQCLPLEVFSWSLLGGRVICSRVERVVATVEWVDGRDEELDCDCCVDCCVECVVPVVACCLVVEDDGDGDGDDRCVVDDEVCPKVVGVVVVGALDVTVVDSSSTSQGFSK